MLNTTQAARTLKITEDRVRQLIRNKKLRALKIGRDWIIHDEDLKIFIKTPRKNGRPADIVN